MPARKGTVKGQQPVLCVEVMSIWDMTSGQMIEHCRLRHRTELGFITKNEHEAAHRLREHPDHTHTNHSEPEPEKLPATPEPESPDPEPAPRPAPARSTGTRTRRPAR